MGKLMKTLPLLILVVSSVYGIYEGLNKSQTPAFDGIWSIINYYYAKDIVVNSMYGLKIGFHNIYLSLIYGVLGFISGGLFTAKFLFSSWMVWTTTLITATNIDLKLFIVLEALSSVGIIFSVMILGYSVLIKNRDYMIPLKLLCVFIIILLIGGVVEYYALTRFT